MKRVNIQRSPYFSKKLEGNECQRFIKKSNLEILSKLLEESIMPSHIQIKVLQVLSDIREVYTSCCGSNLDSNHRTVTRNFKNSWQAMFEEPEVKLSWTPKAHHIADHMTESTLNYFGGFLKIVPKIWI